MSSKRKRTLAEELTELTLPAPTDFDGEDAQAFGDGGARLQDSDAEEAPPSKPRRSVAEKGLRLRGEVELGEEYRGSKVSRRDWEASRRGADDDEALYLPPPAGEEEEEEPERGAGRRGGARRLRSLAGVQAALDADAAALEEELTAVAAAEAAATAALRARAGEERLKAAAVARQQRTWESLLELRIRLQRPLADSARLPRGTAARTALRESAPEASKALSALAREAAATARVLHQLRTQLLRCCGVEAEDDEVEGAREGADALWRRLEEGAAALAPFRDAAFDRWHAKTTLAASAAAAGGAAPLRALNQPLSAQVSAALADGDKARRRWSQPRASALPRLCEPAPAAGAEGERDEGVYNDAQFYEELLKELLEAGGEAAGGGLARAARGARVRKEVDRRASKGRKLRYTVLDKLVNFSVKVPLELPPMAEQLLSRLFGRPTAPVVGA